MQNLLTDDERSQVVLMALAHGPQTEHDLILVVREAEKLRLHENMLKLILRGDVSMYAAGGEVFYSAADSFPPAG